MTTKPLDTYKPLTRNQRLAKQVQTLAELTGRKLEISRLSGYGTPNRYQIVEIVGEHYGEREYSQSLTIGEFESAVSLAVKIATDVTR